MRVPRLSMPALRHDLMTCEASPCIVFSLHAVGEDWIAVLTIPRTSESRANSQFRMIELFSRNAGDRVLDEYSNIL